MANMPFLEMYVFLLAGFLGYQIITRVPSLLHTPLMSATNAISGISLVGSLVAAGANRGALSTTLGVLAVTAATINVVGGFMITDRMLKMFKRQEEMTKHECLNTSNARGVELFADFAKAFVTSIRHYSALPPRPDVRPSSVFIQIAYLVASVLFILGLKGMTAPDKARRGMRLAAHRHARGRDRHAAASPRSSALAGSLSAWWSARAIGAAISIWMPMTAVPQRTAISHAFGALAATLVGIEHYHYHLIQARAKACRASRWPRWASK